MLPSLENPRQNISLLTIKCERTLANVEVNRVKGMRIHAKFTVKYGLDNPCRLIAYFRYDDDEGTPLKSGWYKFHLTMP